MSEHYYSKKQTSRFIKFEFAEELRGNKLSFQTAPGVFSKTRVDKGTELLIESAQLGKSDKILDLGCGYGPLGIALAKSCPECEVTMTEVNERAVRLAKSNAKKNNVNAEVKSGSKYEPVGEDKFDSIFLNPPQTAGRRLCNEMIEEAPKHLNKKGKFWLVARHNIGGSEFEKKMKEVFGNVVAVSKKSGFRVYKSVLD